MASVKSVIQLSDMEISEITTPFKFSGFDLVFGDKIVNDFLGVFNIAFIGTAAVRHIRSSAVFYSKIDIPDDMDYNMIDIGQQMLEAMDAYVCCSWFVKDSSLHIPYCHLVNHMGQFDYLAGYNIYNTCTGEFIKTSFSDDELEKVAAITNKLNELTKKGNIDYSAYREAINQSVLSQTSMLISPGNKFNYNFRNRIERAFMFLKQARRSHFMLMKISFYMNMYECLFSTDISEINHKLAERAACYYTKDSKERKDTFKFIKKAYNVRSKYFHGKELDKDKTFGELPDILKRLDDISRVIFTKVIMEDFDEFLKSDMEDFFTNLIFD